MVKELFDTINLIKNKKIRDLFTKYQTLNHANRIYYGIYNIQNLELKLQSV